MPCEVLPFGSGTIVVCHRGRPPAVRRVTEWCLFCLREGRKVPGTKLCDGERQGAAGTCDKRMCVVHVGRHEEPDRDLCPDCVAPGAAGVAGASRP